MDNGEKRKWGTLGKNYTFVKVGYICKLGHIGAHWGHKYKFVKVRHIKEVVHIGGKFKQLRRFNLR